MYGHVGRSQLPRRIGEIMWHSVGGMDKVQHAFGLDVSVIVHPGSD